MTYRVKQLFSILLLASLSMPLQAEPLNYDYLYLSSGKVSGDNGLDERGESFGLFYSFGDSFHAFAGIDNGASYVSTTANFANWEDFDLTTTRVGAGGHWFVTNNLVVAPALALLQTEVDYWYWDPATPGVRRDGAYSDSGHVLQLDARWQLVPRWELVGGIHHSDIFDNTDTEITMGLLWHPTDWLAIGAIAKEREVSRVSELTARWYF